MTWEAYRDTGHHCREKICVSESLLELKWASTVGDSKKCFSHVLIAK